MNTLIRHRPWIAHIDDERNSGSGIIVTLAAGFCFLADPGCGVRGFDTMTEVRRETRRKDVYLAEGNR